MEEEEKKEDAGDEPKIEEVDEEKEKEEKKTLSRPFGLVVLVHVSHRLQNRIARMFLTIQEEDEESEGGVA